MILVTGGTGLLGSHLLYQLINRGNKVYALRRKSSDVNEVKKVFNYYNPIMVNELFDQIEWVEGDVLDYDVLCNCLDRVNYVYHAAAYVSFNPKDKDKIFVCNVEGTANVVNAALEKGIKKLCFVSSTSAIGRLPEGEKADETTFWKSPKGNTVYGLSKFRSEMEVWRGMEEGLTAVIVNPSIILGPGNWTRSSLLLFTNIWKGMKFYTRGVTGYIDVRDVVKCMIGLMETDISGERFILSEGNYSYQEVLNLIAEAFGKVKPSLYANRFLTSLAWRADWLKYHVTGKPRLITRETARAAHDKVEFSNEKMIHRLDYTFIPIADTIQWITEKFIDSGEKKMHR